MGRRARRRAPLIAGLLNLAGARRLKLQVDDPLVNLPQEASTGHPACGTGKWECACKDFYEDLREICEGSFYAENGDCSDIIYKAWTDQLQDEYTDLVFKILLTPNRNLANRPASQLSMPVFWAGFSWGLGTRQTMDEMLTNVSSEEVVFRDIEHADTPIGHALRKRNWDRRCHASTHDSKLWGALSKTFANHSRRIEEENEGQLQETLKKLKDKATNAATAGGVGGAATVVAAGVAAVALTPEIIGLGILGGIAGGITGIVGLIAHNNHSNVALDKAASKLSVVLVLINYQVEKLRKTFLVKHELRNLHVFDNIVVLDLKNGCSKSLLQLISSELHSNEPVVSCVSAGVAAIRNSENNYASVGNYTDKVKKLEFGEKTRQERMIKMMDTTESYVKTASSIASQLEACYTRGIVWRSRSTLLTVKVEAKFSMLASEKICGGGTWGRQRKKLADTKSLQVCASRVQRDEACSDTFYFVPAESKCRCVLIGKQCAIDSYAGSHVYRLFGHQACDFTVGAGVSGRDYIKFQVYGPSDATITFEYRVQGSYGSWASFGPPTYQDGIWSSGEWTSGNPGYDQNITINGVSCFTTETAAVAHGPLGQAAQWIRSGRGKSCDDACSSFGSFCRDDVWPKSKGDFEAILSSMDKTCKTIRTTTYDYSPVDKDGRCYWKGSGTLRCSRNGKKSHRRFCPCEATTTTTTTTEVSRTGLVEGNWWFYRNGTKSYYNLRVEDEEHIIFRDPGDDVEGRLQLRDGWFEGMVKGSARKGTVRLRQAGNIISQIKDETANEWKWNEEVTAQQASRPGLEGNWFHDHGEKRYYYNLRDGNDTHIIFRVPGNDAEIQLQWRDGWFDGKVEGGQNGTNGTIRLRQAWRIVSQCKDEKADDWSEEVIAHQACEDTDNGAKDYYDNACAPYSQNPSWCGKYDDVDFTSSKMCCACGGGGQACEDTDNGAKDSHEYTCAAYSQNPSLCGQNDDSDFQSSKMCCACGGGQAANPGIEGIWFYGDGKKNYTLKLEGDKHIIFRDGHDEEVRLKLHEGWFEGELKVSKGRFGRLVGSNSKGSQPKGFIRLRQEWYIVSQFKHETADEWSEEVIAHQASRPGLEGIWSSTGKESYSYDLTVEDNTHIIFRHSDAEVRLELRDGWFESKESKVEKGWFGRGGKNIRLRLAGHIVLQFRDETNETANETADWSEEVIAHQDEVEDVLKCERLCTESHGCTHFNVFTSIHVFESDRSCQLFSRDYELYHEPAEMDVVSGRPSKDEKDKLKTLDAFVRKMREEKGEKDAPENESVATGSAIPQSDNLPRFAEDSKVRIIDVTSFVDADAFEKLDRRCCCDKYKTGLAGFSEKARAVANYCTITRESKCGDVKVRKDTVKAHHYGKTGGKCEILRDALPDGFQALNAGHYCPRKEYEFEGMKVDIPEAAIGETRSAPCMGSFLGNVTCLFGTKTLGYWGPVQCGGGPSWCPAIPALDDDDPEIPAATQGDVSDVRCIEGKEPSTYRAECSEKGWIGKGGLIKGFEGTFPPVCETERVDHYG